MARVSSLLSFCFTLFIFFHGYTAQKFPNECQLDQLNALEPKHVLKSEAGRIEIWDHQAPQLRCSGVSFARYTIEAKGLYLPAFYNTAKLSFVAKGHGLMGRVIPGCAETYQDSPLFQPSRGAKYGEGQGQEGRQGQGQEGRQGQDQEGRQGQDQEGRQGEGQEGRQGEGQEGRQGQGQGQEQGQRQRQSFRDMHQKVEQIRSGDTIATSPGVSQWFYNDGHQPLVIVSVFDLASFQNQLDRNPRPFYLAGNNPEGQVWLQGREQQPQKHILSGFAPEIIAKAWNIGLELAQKIQKPNGKHGNIVRVEGEFSAIRPPLRGQRPHEEEEERGGEGNGLEETICSARVTENLDDPSNADVYKPQLGYISILNSYDLPILRFLRLSALRGSIRQNAMVLPQWNANANAVLYVTEGEAQVQVVNDNGDRVFDGQISQGQLLAIPQGFAVVKRATSQQFEWVEFKTNANAQINTLAGRTSVMRGLPLEVVSNGFGISLKEARRVKFNTIETTLTHSTGPISEGRPRVAYA